MKIDKQILKKFFDEELAEIKKNKLRFGIIFSIFIVTLGIFLFSGESEEVKVAVKNPEKVVEPKKSIKSVKKKKEVQARLKKIEGLERVSLNAEIINPFKPDVEPVIENKIELPKTEIVPAFKLPKVEIKKPVEESKIILILKGTAISESKRIAIISRGIFKNKSDTKNNIETLMVKIGDEVDGKKIINIERNFVMFNDGEKLYLQEGQP